MNGCWQRWHTREPDHAEDTTFLWFDGNAEEAADFYVSIFKNSKVLSTMGPKGQAMGVTFQLEGQQFIGLNGGPKYKFTPAISLYVSCETQAEVDELWGKLSDGQYEQCGWLQDKYGLSWQIIPAILGKLLGTRTGRRPTGPCRPCFR